MALSFTNAPQHAQSALQKLPQHQQTADNLTAHLASRYHQQLATASLSSQAIVAINTYKGSTQGPDGGKDGSAQQAVEDLAMRAYTRLGQRLEDQAVVFLGDAGAGKSTLRGHLLNALLSYSATPLSKKIEHAAFVFDAFTTTKSLHSLTASKSGLLLELQYNTSTSHYATLVGAQLIAHRLERSRVASVPTGDRNYHILYYLLAGTSEAEKHHLALDLLTPDGPGSRASMASQKRWRYLGHPSQLRIGIDDAKSFQEFKTALRKLEFGRENIAAVCEVLAAILHIGQLEFVTGKSTTPTADDSGGFSHEGGESVTMVKNRESLAPVARFLGTTMDDLEQSLRYRTRTLGKDRVTVMLDPKGARANADELARTLYSLLVAYVMERVNTRISFPVERVSNSISIVDFPGFALSAATGSNLDLLLSNCATECLAWVCQQRFFGRQIQDMEEEGIHIPVLEFYDNTQGKVGLLKPGNGVLAILDDQMRRGKTDMQFLETIRRRFQNGKNDCIIAGQPMVTQPGSNFPTPNTSTSFTVRHWAGEVDYHVDNLMEENAELVTGDIMNLFRSTRNEFIRELLEQDVVKAIPHPKEKSTIVQASVSSKPTRKPSVTKRNSDGASRFGLPRNAFSDEPASDADSAVSGEKKSDKQTGAAGQFLSALKTLESALTKANSYFVFCLKPNDRRMANQFNSEFVRMQVRDLGISEISQRLRVADFSIFLPYAEFLGLAGPDTSIIGSERERAETVLGSKQWPANEVGLGATGVYLSERCWLELAGLPENMPATRGISGSEDNLLTPGPGQSFHDAETGLLAPSPNAFFGSDKGGNYFGSRDVDSRSDAPSGIANGDMFHGVGKIDVLDEKASDPKLEEVDVVKEPASRKRWMALVWFMTWFIPDFLIRWVGRMKRPDVRTAWREKLAINMLIWLTCAAFVFLMIGFPKLVCPTQEVLSLAELTTYNGKDGNKAYVSMRGIVYDLGQFIPAHYPSIIPDEQLLKYAGTDATNIFPVQVSALCNGIDGKGIHPGVQLNYRSSNYTDQTNLIRREDPNARYHDFRAFTNDSRRDWWYEQQHYMESNWKKSRIGYSPEYMKTLAKKGSVIAHMYGRVYDLTDYIPGGREVKERQDGDPWDAHTSLEPDTNFIHQAVTDVFRTQAGNDVTEFWEALPVDSATKGRMRQCLDNLFYVGEVDTRGSTRCLFAKYFLLAISILLVSVIGFKFLAALQFTRNTAPERYDKFVMCTVPAYTEDEESLRRAIDSAASMQYDDKRKLLVVICDGMIVGQGNDKSTPRIVLDILGVPETVDPEPLSFESLGEGQRRHNMGKVYAGLYEVQGHIVPFLVVVKTGKPSEVSRPGNRGKRDTQVLIMRYLNRVHYNAPMSPLELEMHHQIRNIIGVNPTFYEFLLQIDADTEVAPDSATRFVASFLADTKLIAVCGETSLSNAKHSITTMMQVYEYYISHNLTKAFESLFGSVTCLPGCFTMYRIMATDTGKPLFVSKEVVEAYQNCRVDTLHMKNLLHLGEDRYLTTLLLKCHHKYKTKYLNRAQAKTVAPDDWKVFLSQRRRWINSTVHNLIELMPLQQLCGFFCFSMRFIVFLDLLSTVVAPVFVVYIGYLAYLLKTQKDQIPITAIILLGAIYGLQALIFMIRRKWEMIGWMIIYLLATPIFSFCLPLYAFWHMDDFSWGNTRVVMGEKGQKIVISDEGKFDPASIPKKKWDDYQAELWERHSAMQDSRSEISGISYGTRRFMGPGSVAGSEYGAMPPSRPMSNIDLARYANNSRMSLAPSVYGAYDGLEMASLNFPSDEELLAQIRDILQGSDLMTITKKAVKLELEKRFGMDLTLKKSFIGHAVESILIGQSH
ncbi:glycosyltransferase family 2 protein [Sporormia fimetaria CBS 119925]|uniref:chitin synthase n=1 Tax=Sporormia fimetaria CBS 119925 TaxID=1340428 RepID=A0A6A6VBA6_9PLEO|nr:glycosyltransferase family 2 protein [Sporormia fimetaria CBS 119925]